MDVMTAALAGNIRYKKLVIHNRLNLPSSLPGVQPRRRDTVVVLSDGSNAAKERAGDSGTDAKPASGDLVNGSVGAEVTAMQKALAALGYDLGPYGVDGEFGDDTEAALRAFQKKAGVDQSGAYDAKTREALMADASAQGGDTQPTPEPVAPVRQVEVTGLNVNVRKGNGTQYARVVILPYGTKLEYVATAENGWHAVVVNDQVGWISGNFSKLL